jgi:hypothetical protein
MHEEFVAHAARAVPDKIASSTIAIVASVNKIARQLGSGFLLAIADARFIVTAAHVLDEGQASAATVGVSARPPHFVVPLGEWTRSVASSPDAHDFHDVAVCKLSDTEVDRFDGASFLRLSDFCFDRQLNDGYFLICGFPNLWATTADQLNDTINLRMLQYSGPAYDGDVAGLEFYDVRNHLLIDAQEEGSLGPGGREMVMRTRGGVRAQLPGDLKGASGCGVWQIGSLGVPVADWVSTDAKLVGFFTVTYHRVTSSEQHVVGR